MSTFASITVLFADNQTFVVPFSSDWLVYELYFTAFNSSYTFVFNGTVAYAGIVTSWRPTTILFGNSFVDGYNPIDYGHSQLSIDDVRVCYPCCTPPCSNLSPPPPTTPIVAPTTVPVCPLPPLSGATCVNGILTYVGPIVVSNGPLQAGIPIEIIGACIVVHVSLLTPLPATGDLTVLNGVVFQVPPSGSTPLNVTGQATVGSELVVVFSTVPEDGTSLPILTSGSISGNFTRVTVVTKDKTSACLCTAHC